ncbi:YncE family protein [Parasphingorhabdus sp.]
MATKPYLSALLMLALSASLSACTAAAENPELRLSDQRGTLLIGNKGEDTLSFVDLRTGKELAKKDTGHQPHEIAISPDSRLAAVVSYGGESIDIFDIAAREKVETIDLTPNKRPHGVIWLNDGRIMATTEGSDSVTIVSPPTGEAQTRTVSSISTGQKGSHMLAISPDKERGYVSNMQSGTVSVLNLKTGQKIIDLPAGKEPEGLALTPDGKRLLVADRQNNMLFVFDTKTLAEIAAVETGNFPIRVAVSPDGQTAVTSDLGDGALGLFDLETLAFTRTISVSGDKRSGQVTILFSTNGDKIYAAETGTNRIAEIDLESGQVERRLPAGTNGDGLGIALPM